MVGLGAISDQHARASLGYRKWPTKLVERRGYTLGARPREAPLQLLRPPMRRDGIRPAEPGQTSLAPIVIELGHHEKFSGHAEK